LFYLISKSFYIACLFTYFMYKTSMILKSLIKGVVVMVGAVAMADVVEPADVADVAA